ncbi:lipopolysaccharide biosynthesis protein [Acinetobacter sp. YH01013]|uniref:lipopolysaccharide biosynthesis protein n=1 Tax=Acinetobacter sp. YH01013 TaxID=2601029 RepID=UPI0015D33D56|nr:oligosaccharide flippase family protein [Acinetobacter sp. YH01013]
MSFLNKAVKFGGGVILAQLITAVSIPLLTRIYTPENFSKFGLYFSFSLIFVCFVTMKLEMVLVKEVNIYKNLNKLINVAYLTIIPIGFFSYLALSVIEGEFNLFNVLVSILIMLGAFSFAIFDTINITNIRDNNISLSNKARVSRSLTSVLFQVFFNFLPKVGLFLGEIIGRLFGLLILSKKKYYILNIKEGFDFFKENFIYIKYIVFANFINSLGANIYPILVMVFYDPILVGKYFFIHKILAAPISLITQSISISILGDFNKLIKQQKDVLIRNLNKVSLILFFLSSIVFLLFGFFVGFFEEILFGDTWKGSSIFIFLLIPLLVGQSSFSPFSQLLVLLGGEKKQLIWDLSRVILIFSLVIMVNIFDFIEVSFHTLLLIYSILSFIFYIIHYLMIIGQINGKRKVEQL